MLALLWCDSSIHQNAENPPARPKSHERVLETHSGLLQSSAPLSAQHYFQFFLGDVPPIPALKVFVGSSSLKCSTIDSGMWYRRP